MNKAIDIPEKERALVLQGGGSLGAYGAGVYRGFYESLSKMDAKEGNKGKPIFDIIAGISIGAINAAVLVNWYRVRGLKYNVPRLGICLINLHPKKQAEIPVDRDDVINRNNDITFSDRTHKEEAMFLLISDYIDLVRTVMKIAGKRKWSK